ncbi:MAG TPA: SDR family NAD(P)-dependent oxidoreductase [Thermoleophilaceae bacterium]|nr:SDR family NAD(P)-dependent oxidoreductase [Thermoleophilaceae bacterium]
MASARTILISGASGAIGADVVRSLARRGARLAISARRADILMALADEIEAAGGIRPLVLSADLSQRGEAGELARRATDALGDVDVLVNNAGASVQGLIATVADRDEARHVFETNLWSPLALVAELAPRMLERGAGTIVNVGSMVRVSPYPHLGHYAASRAALALATEVLELELAPRGVRVVEVALGPIDTPASRENRLLAGADRWLDGRPGVGRADAAARAIVAAVEGDARGVVFHPRSLRWADRLPALGRRYSRRMARGADLFDHTVRLGGSAGDPELQAVHRDWAATAGDPR